MKKISIIGDGAWGTTLAILLAEKGFPVTVWSAFADYASEVQFTRDNRKFLPNIHIPDDVLFTADLETALGTAEIVVLAVPSQYVVGVLKRIKQLPVEDKIFVSVIKGLELKSFMTMSQLIQKELGRVQVAVLSGPTIAIELARKKPTTAVVACASAKVAKELQDIFSGDFFRVYTNRDVVGVELCGSFKNVIAIACGVCDGLGFGANAKSALMTRGLVEMARLGKVFKAKPETFMGLAGLGDLATTCFSADSRNRSVGQELGKGRSIKDILDSMDAVAEGVVTVKAVHHLARKHKIEMPITRAVYEIIYREKPVYQAVADLMLRSLKQE
jgi:glycerol-3-phosphate dehydrogenase (NAD(P)+)